MRPLKEYLRLSSDCGRLECGDDRRGGGRQRDDAGEEARARRGGGRDAHGQEA